MAMSLVGGTSSRIFVCGGCGSYRPSRSRRLRVTAAAGGDAAVRVRFAPSPTGNLHVGGARTALFNYLFTKNHGGKFILRIEDTDIERSTKESENAMLQDLEWLGLDWDEGPGKPGEVGPYRQSERNSIYQNYAQKLLESGHVYKCFCSDEELARMKELAELKKLPPRYTGKWATASKQEVDAEIARGTPYTYRFRVPRTGSVTINDLIRGVVTWKHDVLGDFVILRSNGQPVYNFCVAIDDACMKITHVIRAEEHLSNTLRQVLIYKALNLPVPRFGHVSLILAPDRTKLSKRHGATSVGQFREMGYLPDAMVNYLALLGWNDGTDKEIFTKDELMEKFSLERITKSAAIFDQTKLSWLNGKYLHQLPDEELVKLISSHWLKAGILSHADSSFTKEAVELLKDGIDVVARSEVPLLKLLSYNLAQTLESKSLGDLVKDNLREVAEALISAHDNGELASALESGRDGWQTWTKSFGKKLNRKGKRLFMPLRMLLTGELHGSDLGSSMVLLHKAAQQQCVTAPQFTPLSSRISQLKELDWSKLQEDHQTIEAAAAAA
ncbi:hypothetical protein SELMODRAFT_172681 [Selaginella moellendorffii]|uniref:glutamate--tRNA ligase n=1 Tax=Selaginella moellendorffii TaxID=88036 RepID=D8RME9_SELML|nr:glutamate--tRNA ligase, chloroplastic/mitochondrial [Selaginella moellendorffii]EFJ26519.1 hypothetical protein SELMODRAFT_172681 [Selaginella moellendorffii]|eukprot:XP_002972433.1 glutamate--tRNA ligase, chloroplastic/mitochondrial [Selaginella moellendorffii]